MNYRVVIWKQSITDAVGAADSAKTYDYSETLTVSGKPETTVYGNTVSTSGKTQSYRGFTLNASSTKNPAVTINPDGTTIVNVYYDRLVCTVNYYLYQYISMAGR